MAKLSKASAPKTEKPRGTFIGNVWEHTDKNGNTFYALTLDAGRVLELTDQDSLLLFANKTAAKPGKREPKFRVMVNVDEE